MINIVGLCKYKVVHVRFTGSTKKVIESAGKIAKEATESMPKAIATSVTSPAISVTSVAQKLKQDTYDMENKSNISKLSLSQPESIKDKIPITLQPGLYTPKTIFTSFFNNVPKNTTNVLPDDTVDSVPLASSVPILQPPVNCNIPTNLVEKNNVSEITGALQDLAEKGLYNLKTNKLSSEFYTLLNKQAAPEIQHIVPLTLEEFNQNPNMSLGLLKLNPNSTAILLEGKQLHIIVLYTINNNMKVVWGYLTSEDNPDHIKLSDYQPFSKKQDQPQFLKLINPILVNNNMVEALSPAYQGIANAYVHTPVIQEKFTKSFIQKIIPNLTKGIKLYSNDAGFTLKDFKEASTNFEKSNQAKALTLYDNYKNKHGWSEEKKQKWLDKIKITNKYVYPYLINLIQNNHGKK